MAFRGGRGGGRGGRGGWGGGGGGHYVAPKPFLLFPDMELPDIKAVKEEKSLVSMSLKWENFWKSSAYYLEESNNSGQTNSSEIERYCDKNKKRTASQRDSMYQILQLTSSNFPRVLIAGSKDVRSRKRVRWNPLKDMERLEALEKKAGDGTSGKKKAEGGDDSEKEDDEDADDDKPKEGEEEFSDDGDYNQNIDFDDDEDDFNMDDGGDEEAEF